MADDLHEVGAKLAIAELIHTYARHVRRDEPERVSALFTDDGWFEMRDGHPDRAEFTVRNRLDGPVQIDAHIGAGKGKPHPVPVIHNLIVEVDGDTAEANCVMQAQIFGTDHKVMGEYRDRLRRIEGRWRFASRIFTMYSAVSTV